MPRMADSSHLVVKKTFLEVVDEPIHLGLRERSSSDFAVYRAGDKSAAIAVEDGGSTFDSELSGLSDVETDADVGQALVPYSSSDNGGTPEGPPASSTAASNTSDTPRRTTKDSASAAEQAAATVPGLDALLLENARLAKENAMLVETARLAQETALLREKARLAAASPGQVHNQGPLAAASDVMVADAHTVAAAGPWLQAQCMMPWPAAGCPVMWLQPQGVHGCGPGPAANPSRHSCGSGEGFASAQAAGRRTTVMLRNLPNNYTRSMVLTMLNKEGFGGQFDFLYLPIDFKTGACLGYAFINLVCPSLVDTFWETFDGYSRWALPSRKVCGVTWSGPHQGLEAHVERYRNSPVMHPSVPDEYRPVMLRGGRRTPFPEPTKALRPPRERNAAAASPGAP